LLFETNQAKGFLDTRKSLLAKPGTKRMEPALIFVHCKVQILPDRMLFENRWFLKFAADPGARDSGFVQTSQVDRLAQENVPAVRFGLPGNNIHHRCFSGAVGPDDTTQFSIVDGKRKLIQRLDAVEADGNIVKVKNHLVREIDLAGNVEMS